MEGGREVQAGFRWRNYDCERKQRRRQAWTGFGYTRTGSVFRREGLVSTASPSAQASPRGKRADALRNEQTLLAAAAAVFVASGVDAPIREIATAAGVGIGTIYRHFPTRADLIVAVFRHQVEACAEAGPTLLASADSPFAALRGWVDLFVDFLVTKHGLAHALSDSDGFEALHTYFLDRLVPVCGQLLDAAVSAGEARPGAERL